MTDRPTDLSSLPSYQAPRRSLFSARKFALMASVVAGLGVAVIVVGILALVYVLRVMEKSGN